MAYINPQSYSNLELYDCGVLSELVGCDIKVTYICSELVCEPPLGSLVMRLFTYNKKHKLLRPFFYLLNFLRLIVYLIKERFEVVHVQWLRLPLFESIVLLLVKLLFLRKTFFVFTAHNVFPHNSGRVRRLIYLPVYFVFDHYIVHDAESSRFISKISPQKPVSIIDHGPLPLRDIGEVENSVSDFCERYCGRFCLVFGTASQYKGSDLVMQAWESSSAREFGFGLLVLGRGYDRVVDADNNSGVLVVDRYVDEATLAYAIQCCAFGLLPYREISQSGVFMSYVHYGKPCLLSYRGVFKEVIDEFGLQPAIYELTSSFVSQQLDLFCSQLLDGSLDYPAEQLRTKFSWRVASKATMDLYNKGFN